jgi:glycosyltransferase involved in cell wall biosynthesis
VAATFAKADAAVALMRDTSWNTRAGLPNKVFEAIAAGVPMVASDMFALRRMVRQYELGVLCVSARPESIAAALWQILAPDAQSYFRGRVRAAQATLNWQREAGGCALFTEILV